MDVYIYQTFSMVRNRRKSVQFLVLIIVFLDTFLYYSHNFTMYKIEVYTQQQSFANINDDSHEECKPNMHHGKKSTILRFLSYSKPDTALLKVAFLFLTAFVFQIAAAVDWYLRFNRQLVRTFLVTLF